MLPAAPTPRLVNASPAWSPALVRYATSLSTNCGETFNPEPSVSSVRAPMVTFTETICDTVFGLKKPKRASDAWSTIIS
jgi:hypothetical protein